ncbi:MAG: hypothetical protein Q8940_22820, partial [Bacteroidota bacterium]|nr:hypothetical protein [Bacteroidota bacterium]
MINKYTLVLVLIFCGILLAQEKENKFLIFKAGVAKNSLGSFNVGGGGDGYSNWNKGPHFALGTEFYLGRVASLQILGEYSVFTFDNSLFEGGDRFNNAKNSIFDLMANLKLNIGYFYFLGGLGFSNQHGDEVIYKSEQNTSRDNYSIFYPEKNKFLIAGLLGMGFDIHIYENISLILEGDIRMREYMGTAAL